MCSKLSEKAKANKARYIADYNKRKYVQLPVRIPAEDVECIKSHAVDVAGSFNRYICELIAQDIDRQFNSKI